MGRRLKASFTVETSFVMGISLMVIMSVLFLGFYIYDNNTIRCVQNEVLQDALSLDWQEQKIQEELTKRLKNRLYYTEVLDTQAERNAGKIFISARLKINLPIRGIKYYTEEILKSSIMKAGISIDSAAESTRKTEALKKLGSEELHLKAELPGGGK